VDRSTVDERAESTLEGSSTLQSGGGGKRDDRGTCDAVREREDTDMVAVSVVML
jgi:hypothetical protein